MRLCGWISFSNYSIENACSLYKFYQTVQNRFQWSLQKQRKTHSKIIPNGIFQPLLKAHQITIDPKEYKSHWVKQSQMWLSNLVGPDSTRINVSNSCLFHMIFRSDFPSTIKVRIQGYSTVFEHENKDILLYLKSRYIPFIFIVW